MGITAVASGTAMAQSYPGKLNRQKKEACMLAAELKQDMQQKRETLSDAHATRLHRAISWLSCAEQQAAEADLQFISLWISFNACYGVAEEKLQSLAERDMFQRFIYKLVKHDQQKAIYTALWETYSGPVKALIKNPYVFQPFWLAQRGDGNMCEEWRNRFDKSSVAALNALSRQQVAELLSIVLDRLYVLRNQIMHGGATFKSSVNREQVNDGCRMLKHLLPIIINIMLNADDEDWGEIYYPVVSVNV
jgi:hypothetical protein